MGAILFDETVRQRMAHGVPVAMPAALTERGIIPGVKVDKGAVSLANFPDEKITQGLDGLRERLIEYRELEARFTKWRAVISIGEHIPSRPCLEANAQSLARFAALSQEVGLVPIVEPEVLMDGSHTLDRCEEVTSTVLECVFSALFKYRVVLEHILLKTGMILSGAECPQQAGVEEVAEATLRCFRRVVPAALPGIVFLSGGQSDELATLRLNAICKKSAEVPWRLSFSFGRALQSPALKIWKGSSANAPSAQAAPAPPGQVQQPCFEREILNFDGGSEYGKHPMTSTRTVPIQENGMQVPEKSVAFGAPGIAPRWTSSAKEGLGTAYHTSCRLWFTLSHGIVNEIYYPNVDQPNTRDFQLLISDGESFCHEEKRDLEHRIEYPERDCPFYRLTNSDRSGRYRLTKHVLADPHRSVLLVHNKLDLFDQSLRGKLRIYALLAPHIGRHGRGNSGYCVETGGNWLIHAKRQGLHLIMGCSTGLSRRSVGFVGRSDGWQDLMGNFQMDWEFTVAEDGNIALIGEINLPESNEFTVAIALGGSYQSTVAKLLQSLATPFNAHRDSYVRQWQRTVINPKYDFADNTSDGGSMYRLSRCILLAHEDKTFQGALIAAMSIPWGETKDDADLGGYHLVWTRDLVQSATALLATGQTATPLRALIWLAAIQNADGKFPQNSWINGEAYWSAVQLDEIAAPILLAWRLQCEGASFGLFDPTTMIFRAASYLIKQGPVTAQDRWEENSGYSPSTLATVIAGLVCASEFAKQRDETSTADFILDYADWLSAHVEEWTVTTKGELVDGFPRHYLRVNPVDPHAPDPHADPNSSMLQIANGGGLHSARNIVGGDFLHLVRLGIRAANDPLVLHSVQVIDRVLKRDLPQGPCWRRYNHDGYGQKEDGGAFDGTGVGRCWPILTGERGHYELAAGNDPKLFIVAMENFANEGGMISEQLWDGDDLPGRHARRGFPTGAAMPLCWSHAEYVSLVRSAHDGVCFDRIEPAFQRYVVNRVRNAYEVWSFQHSVRRMFHARILRIVVMEEATIVWSADGWASTHRTDCIYNHTLDLWFADIPTENCPVDAVIEFTFFWKEAQRWEGRNNSVLVTGESDHAVARSSPK